MAASAGSTPWACSEWVRRALRPTRARPATAWEAPSPPSPMPPWSWATSTPTTSTAARSSCRLELARQAMGKIADALNMSIEEAAQAMFNTVNSNMADAITEISTRKGYDVRDFNLLAIGGGGPLCGAFVAEVLGVKKTIVPRYSSSFCAWSMFFLDIGRDYVRSYLVRSDRADLDAHQQTLQRHGRRGAARCRGVPRRDRRPGRSRSRPRSAIRGSTTCWRSSLPEHEINDAGHQGHGEAVPRAARGALHVLASLGAPGDDQPAPDREDQVGQGPHTEDGHGHQPTRPKR